MEQRLSPEIQFAQHLSSNSPKIRDTAVKKLAKWFKVRSSSGKPFSPEEILKIWKGLFYCMWMSDKPLVQEKLADKISEMIHCFGQPASVYVFIDLFFQTMAREWFGIDRYRIEKFMMFVRRFLRQSFRYLKQQRWKVKPVRNFVLVLTGSVLNATCEKTPSSLKIHVADVYLEELAKVSEKDFKTKKLIRFLDPWCKFLVEAEDSVLLRSVSKSVFLELVESDEPLFPFKVKYDLIANLLLQHASKEGVKKMNRKEMYKLVGIYKDAARGIFPSSRVIVDDEHVGRAIEKKDVTAAARRYLDIQKEIKMEREKLTKTKRECFYEENDASDVSETEEFGSDVAKKRNNKKRLKIVNDVRDVVGRKVMNRKLGDAERKTQSEVNKNFQMSEDIPGKSHIKNKSNCKQDFSDKYIPGKLMMKNKSNCKQDFSDKDIPGKLPIKNKSNCKHDFSDEDKAGQSPMKNKYNCKQDFSDEDIPGKSPIKNKSNSKQDFSDEVIPGKSQIKNKSNCKQDFSDEDIPGKSPIKNKSYCKTSSKSRLKFVTKNKRCVHLPKFTVTPRSEKMLKLPKRDNGGFVVTPQHRGKDGRSTLPISPSENRSDTAVKNLGNSDDVTTALQINSKTSARAVYSFLEKEQKPLTTDSSKNDSNIGGAGDEEHCDVVISTRKEKPKTSAAELKDRNTSNLKKSVSFASFEHFVSAPPAFFRRSASKLKTKSQSPVGILKKSLNYSI